MAKNIQRTYTSTRNYKKKSAKSEGSSDFEDLKSGQDDVNNRRKMVTTNNWSRDTFKSDLAGIKRMGSQSPLKLARESCKKRRVIESATRRKIDDVYGFSATEDEISDSNSCPPDLNTPSVNSVDSSDNLSPVLSSSQPSSLTSNKRTRSNPIKYNLTSTDCATPPLKPTLRHTLSSPVKLPPSSKLPSSQPKPNLVKGLSWPKIQKKDKPAAVERPQNKVDTSKQPFAEKGKKESGNKPITVSGVKQAYQCQEYGEHQKFVDEMKYTMNNLSKSRSVMIRSLSCCNLAMQCLRAEFRQQIRVRSLTGRILHSLKDAPSHKTLALCTAALIFVLTKDQMNSDFDRNTLELFTKLLKGDELDDEEMSGKEQKDHFRISAKVKTIVSKAEESFICRSHKDVTEMCQKGEVSVTMLILSSLLNLMSLRDGQSFKEQLRLLGTLDHVASLVVNNFKLLRPSPFPRSRTPTDVTAPYIILAKVMGPLAVLETASYMNKDNQSYLVVYDGSVLVTALTELLNYCQTVLQGTSNEDSEVVTRSLLATLKVLVNITHDNELGSQRVGEQHSIINNICQCILVLPSSLEGERQFDVLVMGLGLLINLVEYVSQNRQTLEKLTIRVNGKNCKALSHLVDMFLLHNTAAEKSNISLPTPKSIGTTSTNSHSAGCTTSGSTRTSSTSEMLEAISKRLLGAGSSQEESGLDWLEEEDAVIGEDPIGGDIESNQLSSHEHHYSSSSDGAMDDSLVISREELNTAILQAGKQMEHSFITAYCALVLGVMCRYSESCRESIVHGMPSRSFKEMISILQQFVNFSDMVNSVSQSGIESVRKIILYLKEFDKDFK